MVIFALRRRCGGLAGYGSQYWVLGRSCPPGWERGSSRLSSSSVGARASMGAVAEPFVLERSQASFEIQAEDAAGLLRSFAGFVKFGRRMG